MWGVYPLAMDGNVGAVHSDFNLGACVSSESQKTSKICHFGQNGPKMLFFGHNFLTGHRNEVPIAALFSG